MILTKALSRPAVRKARNQAQVPPQEFGIPELVQTLGYPTGAGQVVTPENSKNVATAYRCGNIISDDIAKMPLQTFISRRTGEIERMKPNGFMRNIAWRLEVKPNRWWSPFQFKKNIIQWLLYWGNAYIWQPPNGSRELFVLPSNVTYPVFDVKGDLWYSTTFKNDSKPTYIPDVEIAHLLINPDQTGFVGRGVITFARETLGRQLAAHAAQNALSKHGLSAAGILWLAGDSSPDVRKKVRDMYDEVMSGESNTGRIAVLDKKISKFEPITLNPKDAQFLEGIQQNDADIANYFGLPLPQTQHGETILRKQYPTAIGLPLDDA